DKLVALSVDDLSDAGSIPAASTKQNGRPEGRPFVFLPSSPSPIDLRLQSSAVDGCIRARLHAQVTLDLEIVATLVDVGADVRDVRPSTAHERIAPLLVEADERLEALLHHEDAQADHLDR